MKRQAFSKNSLKNYQGNICLKQLLNKNGAPRHIIRLALQNEIKPIFGNALLKEYEDVLSREKIIKNVPYPQVKD